MSSKINLITMSDVKAEIKKQVESRTKYLENYIKKLERRINKSDEDRLVKVAKEKRK